MPTYLNINYNFMNQVNSTDVSLMSLSMASFSGAMAALVGHDYIVAAGSFVAGVVFSYLYHKFGSSITPTI